MPGLEAGGFYDGNVALAAGAKTSESVHRAPDSSLSLLSTGEGRHRRAQRRRNSVSLGRP
jgi:hypothetical protein